MDYKVMTQSVGMNETTYEGGFEQQVDSEINLPDYCPDIQRILKCTITPKITGVQTAGDRVTADGAALGDRERADVGVPVVVRREGAARRTDHRCLPSTRLYGVARGRLRISGIRARHFEEG